ncbi:hypothetical protein KSF73_03655 [Burkholderiaceae bacterium DAT-1]|nr:hypothetical protein [Burkholderiaceae bacterium DAT-1]
MLQIRDIAHDAHWYRQIVIMPQGESFDEQIETKYDYADLNDEMLKPLTQRKPPVTRPLEIRPVPTQIGGIQAVNLPATISGESHAL